MKLAEIDKDKKTSKTLRTINHNSQKENTENDLTERRLSINTQNSIKKPDENINEKPESCK